MNENSTILIIDDEPALLLGLAAKIKRQGYQVVTATDGSEGLQKARETLPDLILSDVMMPPPDGFALRRIMSEDQRLAPIPFIFLTARSGIEDRVSGMRDGADDYIIKPFVTEELFARIEAVLRRVQVARERGRAEVQESAREDMERLKREILQNFHHEIRTPLSNIVMPLEMVVNNKFEDAQEQIQFVRRALSSVDRLQALVTDFSLLTSIDHDELNQIRQRLDVNNHILLPVQKRLEQYKTKELRFVHQITGTGEILAPRREFSHALVHLVDNAFKFSSPGGRVALDIHILAGGGAMIRVADEGPGIPQHLREKVFERYYQVSQGDRRSHDGLGVGLYLARAVFSNLGGNVTLLENATGCVFQAALPDVGPEDISYG